MAKKYAFGTHETGVMTLFWVENFENATAAKKAAKETLADVNKGDGVVTVTRHLVEDGYQVLVEAPDDMPDDETTMEIIEETVVVAIYDTEVVEAEDEEAA